MFAFCLFVQCCTFIIQQKLCDCIFVSTPPYTSPVVDIMHTVALLKKHQNWWDAGVKTLSRQLFWWRKVEHIAAAAPYTCVHACSKRCHFHVHGRRLYHWSTICVQAPPVARTVLKTFRLHIRLVFFNESVYRLNCFQTTHKVSVAGLNTSPLYVYSIVGLFSSFMHAVCITSMFQQCLGKYSNVQHQQL